MKEHHFLRRFNWAIFSLLFIALAVGIAFIHSASYRIASGVYETYALKQVIRVAIGFGIFFFLLFPKYSVIGDYSLFFYLCCLALLVAVFMFGVNVKGATRWISIGTFRLQPSEFVKLAVILVVARYFSRLKRERIEEFGALVKPLILVLIPMGMVAMQPDLGTALVLVPIFLSIAFAAGTRIRNIVFILLAGILLIFISYPFLKPYQRGRIVSFINPGSNEHKLAEGYQVIQSKAAIGSGKLFGKGLGEGTQNNYDILPERRTDFIFSVIGEEWGFVGSVFVLVVLFGIIFLCMEVAYRAKEMFGRLVVVGVSVLFFWHVVVNVGMTVGLMPVTGLSLPFISFGGSYLLSSFAGLAIAVNVGMHSERPL